MRRASPKARNQDQLNCQVHQPYIPTIRNVMSDPQSSSELPAPEKGADTGFQPGDDTFTHWRNIFNILTGKMTAEGREKFRIARDLRNETEDCKRCDDQRDYLLQYSKFESFPASEVFDPIKYAANKIVMKRPSYPVYE